ncbi:MAG: hypothetical protein UHK60_12050 [Acutalibacteraceae bacterium]|nr:hypothetical protein [Acutalibacteraceae bacterium]
MKKDFRSRGIRFDINGELVSEKEYYEPDIYYLSRYKNLKDCFVRWECFEYAMKVGMESVDSVNFHTDMTTHNPKDLILQNVISSEKIRKIFDDSFKAYTIGMRLTGDEITGQSIYYYPSVWKIHRYGIKGITDPLVINAECSRLLNYLELNDKRYVEYVNMITKLKGFSVTENQDGKVSYKLYAYVKTNY